MRWRWRQAWGMLGLITLMVGCSGRSEAQSLTVLVASSLNEGMQALAEPFEAAHPGLKVVLNAAGSQQLAQQIHQGARADVFASANPEEMERLVQTGEVEAGSVQLLATNELGIVLAEGVRLTQAQDLGQPGLKVVLAAPEVPAGRYTLTFLEQLEADQPGSRERVLGNVVSYEESVRSVLTKVQIGEADAGIVYTSDIPAGMSRLTIPPEWNVRVEYVIAPVKSSPNPALAQAFIQLALSQEGQEILKQYGFRPGGK